MRTYGGLRSQDLDKKCPLLRVFLEKRPLTENCQNFVPKGFTAWPIAVLCANFVKFGRREIGKVVRYLPDQKKFALLSRSRFCTDHAENLPDIVGLLRVLQISSKSAHFRWSNIRKRQHRPSALQRECNIRLKPSCGANNKSHADL